MVAEAINLIRWAATRAFDTDKKIRARKFVPLLDALDAVARIEITIIRTIFLVPATKVTIFVSFAFCTITAPIATKSVFTLIVKETIMADGLLLITVGLANTFDTVCVFKAFDTYAMHASMHKSSFAALSQHVPSGP